MWTALASSPEAKLLLCPPTVGTKHTMALPFPYAFYACSCSDLDLVNAAASAGKRSSQGTAADVARSASAGRDDHVAAADDDAEAEDDSFNPHAPHASYALFPLEHLLFCDDCQRIRCPRCVVEEPMLWYCPSCLFEVPTSSVRSESVR